MLVQSYRDCKKAAAKQTGREEETAVRYLRPTAVKINPIINCEILLRRNYCCIKLHIRQFTGNLVTSFIQREGGTTIIIHQ